MLELNTKTRWGFQRVFVLQEFYDGYEINLAL